jgi:hypothetical protein
MKKMKTMKSCCALIGAAGILSATSLYAYDGTVLMAGTDGGNANGGGLFYAETSANGSFDTFCISIPTHFTIPVTYDYDVSSTISANPGFSPSTISYGTAYIYSQFLSGNAAFGGTKVSSTINNVQAAIWYLQGNLSTTSGGAASGVAGVGSFIPGTSTDLSTWYSSIIAATGLSLSTLSANGLGAFGVEAMNLFYTNGTIAQPQLIDVPEASTVIAGALLLLPLGVSALRIVRKNSIV